MSITRIGRDRPSGGVALTAVAAQFIAERDRWALWGPVFLGAGIGCYFAIPVEPAFWTAPSVLVCALLGLALRPNALILVAAALATAAMACGFSVAQFHAHRVAAPVLAKPMGPLRIAGRVAGVESFARKPRVMLDQLVLPGLAEKDTPVRVRIRLRSADVPRVGERITVLAKLLPPAPPAAPGAYDFRRHAWFARIGGVGYAIGKTRVDAPATGQQTGELGLWISRTRLHLSARIRAAAPGSAGAVAAALITGDRSAIPPDVMAAMRDSGLAHLLAISGLHMGLVAAILFFGLRALLALNESITLHYPIKKLAAGAALCGGFGYLILTGATVPTQRAFLMTGLVLLAVILDRTAISLRLVAWAATVILLIAPESMLGPSFQMSFAAVVALVAVYEDGRRPLSDWLNGGRGRRIALYVAGVALTTLIAGAATGLFAIYHFGRVAHFGLAANLIAVPVTALWIMPWAVIAMALMPFGLEAIALTPMSWGLELVIGVARAVAGWPGAVGLVPAMPVGGLVAVAVGGLWLCLWRRPWRYCGLLGVAAGLAAIPLSPPPDILVSDDGRLMALRTADTWLSRAGQEFATELRAVAGNEHIGCDSLGCIFRLKGNVVALVEDARALPEDCRRADIVVSAVPVRRRCPSPRLVIDRFDVWRHGAHAIWIDTNGLRVETVAASHGARPWSRPVPGQNRRQ